MDSDDFYMDVDDGSYSPVNQHPSNRPLGTAQYMLQGVNGIPLAGLLPILKRIFTFYVLGHAKIAMGSMPGISSQRNSFISPIVLSHVCRLWRQLARSTPYLWTNIAVVDPRPYDIAIVEEFLQLSSGLPLNIDIVQTKSVSPSDRNKVPITQILRRLSSESPRWRHVRLSTYSNLLIQPESVRLLESYAFDPKGDWGMVQIQGLCSHLYPSHTQVLRHVTFEGGHPLSSLQVPWRHLQSLSIHYVSESQQLLPVLANCFSLESFNITLLDNFNGPYNYDEHPIVLPKLRSLKVGDIHDVHHLFGALCLPALEELVINGGFHGPWACQTLTELFDRSGLTNLRSLSWREHERDSSRFDYFPESACVDQDEDEDSEPGASSTSQSEFDSGTDRIQEDDHDDMDSDTTYSDQDDDDLEEDDEDYSEPIVPTEKLIELLQHPALVYLEELKLYFPIGDAFLLALQRTQATTNRGPSTMGRFPVIDRGRQQSTTPAMLPHLKNLVLADAAAKRCSAERVVDLAEARIVVAPQAKPGSVPSKLERIEVHRPFKGGVGSEIEQTLESGFRGIAVKCKGLEVTNIVQEDESVGLFQGISYTIIAPPGIIKND